MSLPTNYKKHLYIQSDGNQYIDTEFVPNSNTRVVLDLEPTSEVASGTAGIFGSRGDGTTHTTFQFTIMANTSSQYRSDYMDDADTFIAVSSYLSRVLIDKNKNVTTINGIIATNPEATWQGVHTAYIGKVNNNGTPTNGSLVGKIYSCKIYDNDTLVRDYIPCENESGEIGLWDDVNSKFYGNKGTGSFTGKVIRPYSKVLFTRRGAPPVTYDPVFANNSWEQIIEACQSGKVPETWNVADQKTMSINGADYLIDIIGKDHDEYSDGTGTAPLTFQLHELYATTYIMNSSSLGNTSGWTSCEMRATTLPAIMALMPTEVQNGIREVNKLTSAGTKSSTINTTADKLFLLSEIELFGSTSYSFSGEGSQYAYYKNDGDKYKYAQDGVGYVWWERSPYKSSMADFCAVSHGGVSRMGSSSTGGVSFAFCF